MSARTAFLIRFHTSVRAPQRERGPCRKCMRWTNTNLGRARVCNIWTGSICGGDGGGVGIGAHTLQVWRCQRANIGSVHACMRMHLIWRPQCMHVTLCRNVGMRACVVAGGGVVYLRRPWRNIVSFLRNIMRRVFRLWMHEWSWCRVVCAACMNTLCGPYFTSRLHARVRVFIDSFFCSGRVLCICAQCTAMIAIANVWAWRVDGLGEWRGIRNSVVYGLFYANWNTKMVHKNSVICFIFYNISFSRYNGKMLLINYANIIILLIL